MKLVKPSFEVLNTDRIGVTSLIRIEKAGRTCYKSDSDLSINTAFEFIRRLLKRGHLSVIEHESFSVRFIIDRGVSHELVRHRLCAFSQESTMYCNYSGGVTFIIPPWVDVEEGIYDYQTRLKVPEESNIWLFTMRHLENQYLRLLRLDWTPQQARSVLPNSLKTEIVVTANLREWRHIFTLRTAKTAHPQMREVMIPLLHRIQMLIPVIFDDIKVEDK